MKKPLLSELTLKEKIAQCMCISLIDVQNRSEVDQRIVRPLEERLQVMQDRQFGCIWCHGGVDYHEKAQLENTFSSVKGPRLPAKETKAWFMETEEVLRIPALNATDAEQGATIMSDLTQIVPPIAVGATNSEQYFYDLGAAMAKELLSAGINWRWTPIVDIMSRFSFSVSRPFSHEPEDLIRFANAHIKGMQDNGVAATAKHFPGGDRFEYRDSHLSATMNSSTMEEWWEEQGPIFQSVIDSGVWSIMTRHDAFPACDSTKIRGKYIPAALSKKVVTDLLKDKMGFKGVVITDNIKMAGIQSFYSTDDLVVELLRAGHDMILSCRIQDIDIVEKAVLDGRLPESRIDDACQRVLDMKEKMGMFRDDYTLDTYNAENVTPITRKLNQEIADKSMTLVRNDNHVLPIDPGKVKNVQVIISSHHDGFVDALQVLKSELEARGMNVSMKRRLENRTELKDIAENHDLIIYAAHGGGMAGVTTLVGDELYTYQYAFVWGGEKSLGVSFENPFIHYDVMGNCEAFVNAYSPSAESMKAFVKAICGEIPFEGVSPVQLNPDRRIW